MTAAAFHALDADGIVRMSSLVRRLRDGGELETLSVLQKAWESTGQACAEHGHLEDPVVGVLEPDQIAFACPWCSGEAVREAWLAEGRRGVA